MSRTRKDRGWNRSKDLWSKRPFSYMESCKYWRKRCAKTERQQDKDLIRKEVGDDSQVQE